MSFLDNARKIFSSKTKFEEMVEAGQANFQKNNVIARGGPAASLIAQWQRNGWLEPIYKDGRVYINPFTPINQEIFIGKVGQDAIFMKGDMLYREHYTRFDQKISLDAIAIGVSRAAWLVPYAQGTVMFCCAVMGGYLGLGAVVTVVTTANKLTVLAQYFFQNEKKFHTAFDNVKPILQDLQFLYKNCPDTFKLFTAVLFRDKSEPISRWKLIGEWLKPDAKEAGVFVGKMLSGNTAEATINAAQKEALALTLASLISFRTVLKEVIKARGALKIAGDVKAAAGIASEVSKLVSGKDKTELNEAFIHKTLSSGCGSSPEVTQCIDRMSKNLGLAITVLEEIKKELETKVM
jgi:hypothetical protein